MTQQTTQQQSQQTGYAKRFNLIGSLSNVKTGQTKDGQTWLSAKLVRRGDKKDATISAFEAKADNLMAAFGEGDEVKLFGYFRPKTFTAPDTGEQITFQQFNVLWSGAPYRKDETAEGGAETSASAEGSEQVSETPAEQPVDEIREALQAMTKAQLVQKAEEDFAYDLDPKTKKNDMVEAMVRLENGEMVGEAA